MWEKTTTIFYKTLFNSRLWDTGAHSSWLIARWSQSSWKKNAGTSRTCKFLIERPPNLYSNYYLVERHQSPHHYTSIKHTQKYHLVVGFLWSFYITNASRPTKQTTDKMNLKFSTGFLQIESWTSTINHLPKIASPFSSSRHAHIAVNNFSAWALSTIEVTYLYTFTYSMYLYSGSFYKA